MTEPVTIPGLVPQKDGSYAFTVECPESRLNPDVLEALAVVGRRYDAIMHPTMGQKIIILNLNVDDAIAAMKTLEKAGAAIRRSPVSQPRICVGTPFCKYAFQDTFSLGKRLYEEFGKVKIPPKMKVAVSGCPACCSWANLMDVGFVAVKSGYKVYVGGHGGAVPTAGREIGKITTHDEVVEVVRLALELFTDQVKKKARFSLVIRNLGMEEVKKQLKL